MSTKFPSRESTRNVILSEKLCARLRREAFERNTSQSAIVRHALQSHFNMLDAAAKRQGAVQ